MVTLWKVTVPWGCRMLTGLATLGGAHAGPQEPWASLVEEVRAMQPQRRRPRGRGAAGQALGARRLGALLPQRVSGGLAGSNCWQSAPPGPSPIIKYLIVIKTHQDESPALRLSARPASPRQAAMTDSSAASSSSPARKGEQKVHQRRPAGGWGGTVPPLRPLFPLPGHLLPH